MRKEGTNINAYFHIVDDLLKNASENGAVLFHIRFHVKTQLSSATQGNFATYATPADPDMERSARKMISAGLA